MAMDVKKANSHPEIQGAGQQKFRTFLYSILEVNSVLAHDVIHDQRDRNILHVVGKSLAYAVVHINLSGNRCE
jgi:hypothetical protein